MLTEETIDFAENQSSGLGYPTLAKNLKAAGVKNYAVAVSGYDRVFKDMSDKEFTLKGHLPKHICEKEFNLEWVKNAVRRTQQGFTDFPTFLKEIAQAGVHTYIADLENMEVSYYGSDMNDKYAEKIPVV